MQYFSSKYFVPIAPRPPPTATMKDKEVAPSTQRGSINTTRHCEILRKPSTLFAINEEENDRPANRHRPVTMMLRRKRSSRSSGEVSTSLLTPPTCSMVVDENGKRNDETPGKHC